jgi:hypothetical protein
MPAKQKVTLYLSDDLHRQFKIRSAIDGETMSSMAQRAMEFYLDHAKLVEGVSVGGECESHGQAHLVHSCPQCAAAVTLRDGSLTLIRDYSERQYGDLTGLERISGQVIPKQGILEQDTVDQCLPNSFSDSLADRRGGSGRTNSESPSKSPEEGELITC